MSHERFLLAYRNDWSAWRLRLAVYLYFYPMRVLGSFSLVSRKTCLWGADEWSYNFTYKLPVDTFVQNFFF